MRKIKILALALALALSLPLCLSFVVAAEEPPAPEDAVPVSTAARAESTDPLPAAQADVYAPTNVAAINQIIAQNWPPEDPYLPAQNNPAGWGYFLQWDDTTSPQEAAYLNISQYELSGTMDVSALTRLQFLDCAVNRLAGLNATGLANLIHLECTGNEITSLDLTGTTGLVNLFCSDNRLTSLDISGQNSLVDFRCTGNPLTSFTAPDGNTITLTQTTGGSVTMGAQKGPSAGTVTLSAVPNANYTFEKWQFSAPASYTAGDETALSVTIAFPGADTVCTPVFKATASSSTVQPAPSSSAAPTQSEQPSSPAQPVLVNTVTLSKTSLGLAKGETARLATTVAPAYAANTALAWSSSSPKVVKVDATGKVTALKNGTATIMAKTIDGSDKSAKVKVYVGKKVTKVKLNKTKLSLKKGKIYTLTATVTPAYAANPKLKWTSSNKKVAKVSSKGRITALKKGTAILSATTTDGSNIKVTCKVTVE